MPGQAITTYLSVNGFIGMASETTKGVGVAATEYVNLMEDTIEHAMGLNPPDLLRQSRQTKQQPVVTEQQITGGFKSPLYVDQGLMVLSALIGSDAWQFDPAASASAVTGNANAAGASTVTLTTLPGTPVLAIGDYLELHQGADAVVLGPTNLSEIHKVGSISGAGPFVVTLEAGETLVNSYSATATAYKATAGPWTHVLWPDVPDANAYKTLSIEKNKAGLVSKQYAGATIGKGSFNATTKSVHDITYAISAIAESTVTASKPALGLSRPVELADLAISLYGVADLSVTAFSFDLDNMAKEYWTMGNGHLPSAVPPTQRSLKGKWTNVAQSSTYYDDALAGTGGAGMFTWAIGSQSIELHFPQLAIEALKDPLKIGEAYMYDIDFTAFVDQSTNVDVFARVISTSKYLPFV